jgi:4-amino-4-deoxy-L-arabinose transferase-like glycosyltransferase
MEMPSNLNRSERLASSAKKRKLQKASRQGSGRRERATARRANSFYGRLSKKPGKKNEKFNERKNGTEYYCIAFLAILVATLAIYYLSSPGIYPPFDDSIYAYSVVKLSILGTAPWTVSAFGFTVMEFPFYALLHSAYATEFPPLIAIAVSMLCLLWIGKEFKSLLAGVTAAVLYAFNPLVMMYGIRLLPDPYIAMADAIGLALALFAIKKKSQVMAFLGGIAVGAGIFFGNQAAFSVISFVPLLALLLYFNRSEIEKGWLAKAFALSIIGIAILGCAYLGQEAFMYGNPLYGIHGQEAYIAARYGTDNIVPSYLFYLYTMLPVKYTSGFPGNQFYGENPYANFGILFILFIIGAVYLFAFSKHKKGEVLPFMAFAAIFYLLLSVLPNGGGRYGVEDMTRLLIPVALVLSIACGIFMSELAKGKRRRMLRISAFAAIVIIYISVGLSFYPAIRYNYSSQSYAWNITYSAITKINQLNFTNYELIENYTNMPYLLCMGAKNQPYNCAGVVVPWKKIPCNGINETRVYEGSSPSIICPASSNYTTSYYYNSTYNYSVYSVRER